MAWLTEGPQTNPLSGALLADTGQLVAQEWRAVIFLSSTVAATMRLQHRNAANDANLRQHEIAVAANTILSLPLVAVSLLNANERLRVITEGTIVGTVQASLFLEG